jgi:hypothetical protein
MTVGSVVSDFEKAHALLGRDLGVIGGTKNNPAAEIGLDRKLQCAIRGTSNLKEKFAEVFGLLRDPVYQYLVTLLGSREEAELGAIQGGGK